MPEIWAVVLAAGESKRMHTPKLLLPYNGKTIIAGVIDNVLRSGIEKIMVVLGSYRDEILKAIEELPVKSCMNENYRDGMLSSVICGFSALPGNAEAALVFLGDQPFIPPQVSRKVIQAWEKTRKGIIIPVSKGRRGHPALFDMKYRAEIAVLDPAAGLRSLTAKFPDDVLEVKTDNPEITRDIDTKNDYLNELYKIKNNEYRRNHKV